MTDSIDLDDIDVQDDERELEQDTGPNHGDWLWRADGDPGGEGDDPGGNPNADSGLTGADIGDRTPRVPSETDSMPVGIPRSSGGAGAGPDARSRGQASESDSADAAPAATDDGDESAPTEPAAEVWDRSALDATDRSGAGVDGDPGSDRTASADVTAGGPQSSGRSGPVGSGESVSGPVGSGGSSGGPHGGDADEMTLAFTYRAARALDDPTAAYGDAKQWSDWLGIVGDVPSHALNKFQRRHVIDLDFFNGAGTRPSERLAEIGPSSMFYADRLVLVGLPDEAGMQPDDWEFRPLPEAAKKADWGYSLPGSESE